MSDELNMTDAAIRRYNSAMRRSGDDEYSTGEAAAVIRDYGDKRYQQAIADVVEWLRRENGLCDCFARSETECACGAWDDHKTWPLERTADEITRRFGKDA